MNREALKRTRDAIAASQTYDQTTYADYACNTPACVAGHAVVAHGYTFTARNDCYKAPVAGVSFLGGEIQNVARVILGLDDSEMAVMFAGLLKTKADALDMLDQAIEYDNVYWQE